jgi:mono/diheme cytochrome c family protein
MKKVLVIVSIILLVGCASYKPVAPAQNDADRATVKIPGTTLADLNQGKAIFEEKCHKCHSLKKPFTKSEEEIKSALPKMAKRAKIDSKQEDLVLKYLLTMTTDQNPK